MPRRSIFAFAVSVLLAALVADAALARAGRVAASSARGARATSGVRPGEALYMRYCASCHGIDGRGDGTVASALRTPPPDLTRLTYGEGELIKQIDGRRTIRAHGTSAMPVWGEIFEQSLIEEPHRRRTTLQRLQTLADYVARLRTAPAETSPPPER